VNRLGLETAAAREGIRRSTYSLEGGLPPERYVLGQASDGWEVYYSERGERTDLVHFDTEDEACDHLLMRLLRDPTTRERAL
jgi:hypothetical protein